MQEASSSATPETSKTVTGKANVIFVTEAAYTELARKNKIQGTVRLRAILTSNGEVTGIEPIQILKNGLTENAIEAAQTMRFLPATKDGRNVSQYVTLVYQFNMY